MIRGKALLPFQAFQCLELRYVASLPSTRIQILLRNKPGHGRKHTLERKIVRDVSKKPWTSVKTTVAELASSGVDVSSNTVVRALHR